MTIKKIAVPWATYGTKADVPTASLIGIDDGRASYQTGFVPLNATPIIDGGIPPWMADWNGAMYDVTVLSQAYSSGLLFKHDGAYSTAIGGYPQNALLVGTDDKTLWLNLAVNNTAAPSEGANWLNATKGRLLNIQVFAASASPATYTPTYGTESIIVEVVGGGGGTDGIPEIGVGQSGISAGAGAGAYAKGWITDKNLFYPSVSVQAGLGGTAGTGDAAVGGVGGSSYFSALIQCAGGTGGAFSIVTSTFPASTTITNDTAEPVTTGCLVIGSCAGVGAESAIIYGEEVGNTLRGGKSAFQGKWGDGGDGVFSYASVLTPAVDGNVGIGGRVIVYEFS